MVRACARRSQVAYAPTQGISLPRGCWLLSVVRSALRCQSRQEIEDAPILVQMQGLSAQCPRFGYHRIQIFLEPLGYFKSLDRANRLWRCAALHRRTKKPPRRIAPSRLRPLASKKPAQMRAYDFLFDACVNGQQLKRLTVIGEFTREGLGMDVPSSLRSFQVNKALATLISLCRAPNYLRFGKTPELLSQTILR